MSGIVTGWVFDNYPARGPGGHNRKIVLLAVANGCNNYGRGARRSVETMAEQLGLHPATVRRHLNALVETGHLTKHLSRGRVPVVYDAAGFVAALSVPGDDGEMFSTRALGRLNPRVLTPQPARNGARLTVLTNERANPRESDAAVARRDAAPANPQQIGEGLAEARTLLRSVKHG
jgi:DNA-binding transcriptional ArsR family regulator